MLFSSSLFAVPGDKRFRGTNERILNGSLSY